MRVYTMKLVGKNYRQSSIGETVVKQLESLDFEIPDCYCDEEVGELFFSGYFHTEKKILQVYSRTGQEGSYANNEYQYLNSLSIGMVCKLIFVEDLRHCGTWFVLQDDNFQDNNSDNSKVSKPTDLGYALIYLMIKNSQYLGESDELQGQQALVNRYGFDKVNAESLFYCLGQSWMALYDVRKILNQLIRLPKRHRKDENFCKLQITDLETEIGVICRLIAKEKSRRLRYPTTNFYAIGKAAFDEYSKNDSVNPMLHSDDIANLCDRYLADLREHNFGYDVMDFIN
jgi:hypothetical protein